MSVVLFGGANDGAAGYGTRGREDTIENIEKLLRDTESAETLRFRAQNRRVGQSNVRVRDIREKKQQGEYVTEEENDAIDALNSAEEREKEVTRQVLRAVSDFAEATAYQLEPKYQTYIQQELAKEDVSDYNMINYWLKEIVEKIKGTYVAQPGFDYTAHRMAHG